MENTAKENARNFNSEAGRGMSHDIWEKSLWNYKALEAQPSKAIMKEFRDVVFAYLCQRTDKYLWNFLQNFRFLMHFGGNYWKLCKHPGQPRQKNLQDSFAHHLPLILIGSWKSLKIGYSISRILQCSTSKMRRESSDGDAHRQLNSVTVGCDSARIYLSFHYRSWEYSIISCTLNEQALEKDESGYFRWLLILNLVIISH